MIAVIFEAMPHAERSEDYFRIASELRPLLEMMDGFISIERYQSLSEPRKVLSLSFWRDERAVAQWRTLAAHRDAQAEGRSLIFKDYRLRIAGIVRDYGMHDRVQAPPDSLVVHD